METRRILNGKDFSLFREGRFVGIVSRSPGVVTLGSGKQKYCLELDFASGQSFTSECDPDFELASQEATNFDEFVAVLEDFGFYFAIGQLRPCFMTG
ncbi:hypothetical protein ACFL6C_03220 [Myxococcota bacterium]